MLQTLTEHLRLSSPSETVTSIQYRNLAPLYCDEKMRVCVRKKKARPLDTETVWDIWIEGPTGGMAVKAVVRTQRRRSASSTELAVDTATNTALPDARTIARQAQDKLRTLAQGDSSPDQLSQLSREERRKLWREEKRTQTGHALSYIYSASSPLSVRLPQPASQIEQPSAPLSNNTEPKVRLRQEQSSMVLRERHQFSRRWRKQWVGRALPYLYLYDTSPLIIRNLAAASEAERSSEPLLSSARGPADNSAAKPTPSSSYLNSTQKSSIAAGSLATRQRRHRPALAMKRLNQTKPKNAEHATNAEAGPRIRVIETEGPKDVLSSTNFQKPADTQNKQQQPRQEVKPLVIKKVEQNSVRRVGVGLGDVEKQGKQKLVRIRKAINKAFLTASERSERANKQQEAK